MNDESIDMSPGHSPDRVNSVRSANNIPIYLGAVVLLIVVAIVAMVASDRAKNVAVKKTDSEEVQVTDTTNMARNIVGQNNLGAYVPPANKPPVQAVIPPDPAPAPSLGPAIEVADSPVELRQDENGNLYSTGTLDAPPIPPMQRPMKELAPTVHEPVDEEAMRIQAAKLQALEAAVRAGTTVEIAAKRSTPVPTASIPAPQNSYTSRQNTLNEISRLRQGSQDDTSEALASLTEQITNATQGRFPISDSTRVNRESEQNKIVANQDSSSRNRWELGTLVEPPKTDYVIRTGFVIPATMISGINSDLPGQVIAQVSQNVWDTSTGKSVLIPQGSKLIGSYVSNIAYAQRRVMVAWQRIVFPDGKALDIGSMPGADIAGYSGLSDQVNNHYLRIFGSALLMSGITASVSLSQGDFDDDDDSRSAREELSAAIGQQLGQVALEMIRKNLDVSPTLEIRPGFRFNVMVTKDLTFDSPYTPYDY